MPFRILQEENEYLTWGNPASDKGLPAKMAVPQVSEVPKSTKQFEELEVITVAPKAVDTSTEVPLTLPSL